MEIRMREMKQEGCRDLEIREGQGRGLHLQHPFSYEWCRSSTVDHDEEMTLESPRKRQEVQEVLKETEWKEARGREEETWRLEPEGETEVPETGVVADGVEGIYVDLDGEGCKFPEGKAKRQEKKMKKLRVRREK